MKFLAFLLFAMAAQAQVRYHFGDDSRWADPSFDDSTWPVVENNAFPAPPMQGDRLVWVRQHLALPTGEAALWLRVGEAAPIPWPAYLRQSHDLPVAGVVGGSVLHGIRADDIMRAEMTIHVFDERAYRTPARARSCVFILLGGRKRLQAATTC